MPYAWLDNVICGVDWVHRRFVNLTLPLLTSGSAFPVPLELTYLFWRFVCMLRMRRLHEGVLKPSVNFLQLALEA